MKKSLNEFLRVLEENGLVVEAKINEADGERLVNDISYNSMDVNEESMFICKGLYFKDVYLEDAIAKGAFCYVAERIINKDVSYIIVNDVRKSMTVIGSFFYDSIWNDKLTMMGITGTKGKTTTTTFVNSIMNDYMDTLGLQKISFLSGNYTFDGVHTRNPKKMTTLETLELHKHLADSIENGCKYMVTEVSSQAVKHGRTDALKFKVATLVNVERDHISDIEHPDFEDYFSCKLGLFKQSEIACINLDLNEEHVARNLEVAKEYCKKIYTYSRYKEEADFYGYDTETGPEELCFKCKHEGGVEDIVVSIGGDYNTSNALAAIAMTRALGVPFENIKNGLANVKVEGRMEIHRIPSKNVDVVVDFAHNTISYNALFGNVHKFYPNRKIMLVFGCRGDKAYNRRKDLGELANQYADKIILTEQDHATEKVVDIAHQIMEHIDEGKVLEIIEDRGEAITKACEVIENDWVLVIAGNGADRYQKRGLTYVEMPTDGEFVEMYNEKH